MHRPTYSDDAARPRRRLRRVKRAADDRTHAVGADEQVALCVVAVFHVQPDAVAVHRESGDRTA